MSDAEERSRLSDALLERSAAAESCPSDETIFDAVGGRLEAAEVRRLADHTTRCGPCTASWSLAQQMLGPGDAAAAPPSAEAGAGLESIDGAAATGSHASHAPAGPDPTARKPATAPRSVWLALAAVLLAAVGLASWNALRDPTGGASFRGQEWAIQSAVPEDRTLPRDAAELLWSAGPEGTTYTLTVSADGTRTLVQEEAWPEASYRIAPQLLSELDPGTRLLWRVQARLPDGTSISSVTFIHELE